MQVLGQMTPQQRQQAHELFQQFRGVPADRRQQMVRTLRQLRSMSPQGRPQALDSPQMRSQYSPSDSKCCATSTISA